MDPISIAMGLAQFAPAVIKWVTGSDKAAEAAAKVASIAQSVTGAQTPAEALEKIKADADLALQFRLAVMANEQELDRMFLADRQSARTRDVELRQLTGGNNKRADLMIVGAVLGLIACLVTLVFFRAQIPGEVIGIVSTVAGIFGACLRDAFQFEFGSSRGSKDKDDLLAQLSFTKGGQ